MRQVSEQRARHLRYVQRKSAKRRRKPGKGPRGGYTRGPSEAEQSIWSSLTPAMAMVQRAFVRASPNGPIPKHETNTVGGGLRWSTTARK